MESVSNWSSIILIHSTGWKKFFSPARQMHCITVSYVRLLLDNTTFKDYMAWLTLVNAIATSAWRMLSTSNVLLTMQRGSHLFTKIQESLICSANFSHVCTLSWSI